MVRIGTAAPLSPLAAADESAPVAVYNENGPVADAAGHSVHRAFFRLGVPQAEYDQSGGCGLPAPAFIRRASGLSRSGVK